MQAQMVIGDLAYRGHYKESIEWLTGVGVNPQIKYQLPVKRHHNNNIIDATIICYIGECTKEEVCIATTII